MERIHAIAFSACTVDIHGTKVIVSTRCAATRAPKATSLTSSHLLLGRDLGVAEWCAQAEPESVDITLEAACLPWEEDHFLLLRPCTFGKRRLATAKRLSTCEDSAKREEVSVDPG